MHDIYDQFHMHMYILEAEIINLTEANQNEIFTLCNSIGITSIKVICKLKTLQGDITNGTWYVR